MNRETEETPDESKREMQMQLHFRGRKSMHKKETQRQAGEEKQLNINEVSSFFHFQFLVICTLLS